MLDLAALMSILASLLVVILVWYVVQIVALWKVFTKAGEAGWKAIIPIYNLYTLYKITWNVKMFWIFVACWIVTYIFSAVGGFLAVIGSLVSLAMLVISVLQCNKFSKAFGCGVGTTVGLVLLNPIFVLILGFGSAQYHGPQA